MRIRFISGLVLTAFYLSSCTINSTDTKKPLTKEQEILNNIDTLKAVAREGDLITRMNDNIVSFHVKNLNETDKAFSHAGVIVMKDGKKLVCNIDAGDK